MPPFYPSPTRAVPITKCATEPILVRFVSGPLYMQPRSERHVRQVRHVRGQHLPAGGDAYQAPEARGRAARRGGRGLPITPFAIESAHRDGVTALHVVGDVDREHEDTLRAALRRHINAGERTSCWIFPG